MDCMTFQSPSIFGDALLILTSIHVSFNIFHPFHGGVVTVSYQCLNCVLKTNNSAICKHQKSANILTIHLNNLFKFPDLSILVSALHMTRTGVLPLSSWELQQEWDEMFALHIQDEILTSSLQ